MESTWVLLTRARTRSIEQDSIVNTDGGEFLALFGKGGIVYTAPTNDNKTVLMDASRSVVAVVEQTPESIFKAIALARGSNENKKQKASSSRKTSRRQKAK